VKNVETDHKQHHVYLYLEYISDQYEDPDTAEPAVLYDHCEMREWRHLDILHYQTYVRCRIPRVKCKNGKVKQVAVGWAGKHDRHSYHFEKEVIDLLLATKNQTKTADFLGCSFRLVNRILHRCVERGLERRDTDKVPFEHISIDEKSFQKGHKYVTVLSHPRSGVVLNVGENRDGKSVKTLLTKTFTKQQLNDINTVSMDMWQPYINTITNKCPNAEIVHDKFHLVAYLNKGIDQVRRREVKQHDELKNSRYVLLKNQNNLTEKQHERFELIKSANFQVSKAWHIRENFKDLFGYSNNEIEAQSIFHNWIQDSYSKSLLTD
jgi:transposase